MEQKFFFDTYALIEIYKGNPNYLKYKNDIDMILNKLNILEYIYFLLREGKNENINGAFDNLDKYSVDFDKNILIESAKMKLKYSKEKLSYTDCIGYNIAKNNNAKFLTGDDKFKDKENVEFVK